MLQPRILILTNRVPFPLNDGGNMAMHAMIDGYYRAGWDVYLLSMNTTRHLVSDEQLSALYPHLSGFKTVNIDNRLKPLGTLQNFIFSKQPNHAQRFSNLKFAKKLNEVLQEFNPGFIQVESIFLTTYLPFIKERSQAKIVLRMHNVEYQIWHRLAKKTDHRIKSIYLKNLTLRIKKFEEKAWQQYDLLLPITEKDAEVVKKLKVITDILIAPYGIDTNILSHNQVNENWCGYHIGAMDWLPNAESITWFIENVWGQLNKAIPAFKFYFAGRHMPPYFKAMKVEGVYCMGEVADANTFIADKKILIVPLRSGGGIRVKILEAMANAKVVISTKVAMQGIDAVPDIHYLSANRPEEFIKAVKWCLENKDKAQQMAEAAEKLIKSKYDETGIIKLVTQKLVTL